METASLGLLTMSHFVTFQTHGCEPPLFSFSTTQKHAQEDDLLLVSGLLLISWKAMKKNMENTGRWWYNTFWYITVYLSENDLL